MKLTKLKWLGFCSNKGLVSELEFRLEFIGTIRFGI